ncbi:MAG: DHHA1 domain-containing protein [bacterium]|nr:DHHA1 domain-containing protein [bacterium]
MRKENTKDTVVVYHADCFDGFTAAWAAWKKLGNDAEYIPFSRYGDFPILKNKKVYIVDYCPETTEDIKKLIQNNKKLVIIDHHVSEAEVIKSAPEHVFNTKHSGAFLAWQYFHSKAPVPELVKYVQDYDLWSFKLSGTREVINMIGFQDLKKATFENWSEIDRILSNKSQKKKYLEKGDIIENYKGIIFRDIIDNQTQKVEFEGYKVLATNCPRIFRSEIGNLLAKKNPPFAIVWSQTSKKTVVSLRGVGDFDVTKIAEKYPGGGGHKSASAFSFPLGTPLPWKVIKEDET